MTGGEYRIEVREAGTNPSDENAWKPAIAFDPVPDNEDMHTEQQAEMLRRIVAKLNRADGWTHFRTRYIPEATS